MMAPQMLLQNLHPILWGLVGVFMLQFLFRYRVVHSFPGPPRNPILGNALDFGFDGAEVLVNLNRIMLGIKGDFRLWMGPNTAFVMLIDPKSVAEVLRRSDPKGSSYDPLRPWLGEGLLTANGQCWRNKRHLLTPAFHFNILREYVRIVPQHVSVFLENMEELVGTGRPVDLFPLVTNLTLDVIGQCAMGISFNSQGNPEQPYVTAVADATKGIIARFLKPWLLNNTLFALSSEGRRFKKQLKLLHQFTDDVITKRRATRAQQQTGEPSSERGLVDFLDLLLETTYEGGKPLDHTEIRDEVDTFLFGGHDTTAAALIWTICELSRHPEHADRCVSEIETIMGDRQIPTWEDLQKMEYLQACLKESMRLYPPVPVMTRVTDQPVNIGGKNLPAGTEFHIAPFLIHRNPVVWEDAQDYAPERFLPNGSATELLKHAETVYAYIPFSAGPRNCIGQKFAQMEVICAVSMIVRRFKFNIVNDADVIPEQQVILRPLRGLVVTVEKR